MSLQKQWSEKIQWLVSCGNFSHLPIKRVYMPHVRFSPAYLSTKGRPIITSSCWPDIRRALEEAARISCRQLGPCGLLTRSYPPF
eukprot:1159203-Pelagomonas_calceolata.AAC.16